MEAFLKVEVTKKSIETLKPSTPTPSHSKTFTLSIDQSFPIVHIPLLLFYATETPPFDDINNIISITNLKTSLSKTLTYFYPLAGRCNGQKAVKCNDQGVPFIETVVNCRLSDVLNSLTKLDRVLPKLLPPPDLFSFGQLPISEVAPLVFQVNVFSCGGIVIGCYLLHKLLDAASISTFLNFWASLARRPNGEDLVRPNFDVAVTTFPPPPHTDDSTTKSAGAGVGAGAGADADAGIAILWLRPSSIKVVGKSFIFNNVAIKKLKDVASSEAVPTPTSFEAVAVFVWGHVMPTEGPSVLSFNASIRTRTKSPLPKESMGNLVVGAHPSVDKRCELHDLVKEIHCQVLKLEHKIETLKGEKGLEAFLEYRQGNSDGKATSYGLTSWCKLGFDKVDFGFGKPTRVVPFGMVHPLLRNMIMFVDYSDLNGDGIEAWLFLEEKEMQMLESNSQFLVYASST